MSPVVSGFSQTVWPVESGFSRTLRISSSRILLAIVAVALLAIGGCSSSSSSPNSATPQIRLTIPPENPAGAFVEVTGLDARVLDELQDAELTDDSWTALLRVSVQVEDPAQPSAIPEADRPAMLGSYSVDGGAVRFTPRFPLDPGRRYQVVFDQARLPGAGDEEPARGRVVAVVSRPKLAVAPSTRVTLIYPSATVVPENQLRMYIHFSAPMGRRGGLDYLHLLDPKGKEIEGPFLPLDTNFWNDDRTRYTVFFDPGRVKRGLLPRKEMGPSLEADRHYTLVVDAAWLDGDGLPLKESFRRQFKVGPPDEQPLDPKGWRIAPPAAGSRGPLVVTFSEPLDHGLLLRALGVATGRGLPVEGDVRIEELETRWLFTPDDPWQAGDYNLVAYSFLEDLAGNRIGRAFEVDRFDEVDRTAEGETTNIPFRIASP